jgi:hypothetical protein
VLKSVLAQKFFFAISVFETAKSGVQNFMLVKNNAQQEIPN